MPEGGPRDVTPPVVVNAEPGIYSTNFSSMKAVVTFDEFIQLKDARKETFISPPMDKPPEFKVRGKSLVIEFQEPLKENTTYSIFFGNAIVDLTEGNPKTNFEYVFSTGNTIDSLVLTGKVLDAFDLKPVKDILVMIYRDNNDTVPFDSMPMLVRPASASRTVDDGSFRIGHLQQGSYKIFALEDKNGNFLYDLPNERIAFLDSLVSPFYIPRKPADSVLADSLMMLEYQKMVDAISEDIILRLFQEADTTQRLLEAKALSEFLLRFSFKRPTREVQLKMIGENMRSGDWCLRETNKTSDTILCWLKDPGADTLYVEVSESQVILDTARLVLRRADPGKRNRNEDDEVGSLKATTNIKANKLELNRELTITFSRPVIEWDNRDFTLIEGEDTIKVNLSFTDEIQRELSLAHEWKEDTGYEFMIPDSVFEGLGEVVNDTLRFVFKTRKLSDYGHLFVDFTPSQPGESYIVQVLTGKEEVLREKVVSEARLLEYRFLLPGRYNLKAIHDRNRNGRWDPGNYSQGLQPETVIYFPTAPDIRANWEVQETWEIY